MCGWENRLRRLLAVATVLLFVMHDASAQFPGDELFKEMIEGEPLTCEKPDRHEETIFRVVTAPDGFFFRSLGASTLTQSTTFGSPICKIIDEVKATFPARVGEVMIEVTLPIQYTVYAHVDCGRFRPIDRPNGEVPLIRNNCMAYGLIARYRAPHP